MRSTPRYLKLLPALAFLAAMGAAQAQTSPGGTISGGYGALNWTAGSTLTGTTNTQSGGPIVNGGNPIYWPSYPRDGGVVQLLMDYGPTVGQFICSGSLLGDRRSILTAAHCVSEGAGTANPLSTTVYFQPPGGLPAGTRIFDGTTLAPNGGAVTRSVSQYFVNSAYTGDVIDKNDIAVLRLSTLAPDWALSYGLYESNDLQSKTFMVEGYGRLGDGATGANSFTSRLRNGDNRYDIRLGDPDFGTDWSVVLGEPMSQIDEVWMSDFDNGLAANDASCVINAALGYAPSAKYCNLGTGAREVGVAGGDSGGPQFIGSLISGVNSFGLTFGLGFGDIDNRLNSSFGEFSGYVPTYLHTAFIRASMVPEPGSIALLGLALLSLTLVYRRRSVRT